MNKRNEIAKTLYCKYSEGLAKEYRTSWEDCPQVHSYYLECADAILAIPIPITTECRECGGRGNKTISFNPNLNPNKFPAIECRKVPCPHCTNGQRVQMKVRKQKYCDECVYLFPTESNQRNCYPRESHRCNKYNTTVRHGMAHPSLPTLDICEQTIKEPLTLADIDFTGELKLKGGWRVE